LFSSSQTTRIIKEMDGGAGKSSKGGKDDEDDD
jgi:hypothetical protein